jgi:hypothetical protein
VEKKMTRRSFFAKLAATVPMLALVRGDVHAEGRAAMDALLAQWPTRADGDVVRVNVYTDIWKQMYAALPSYGRFVRPDEPAPHFAVRHAPVYPGNCMSHILYRRRADGRVVSRMVFFDATEAARFNLAVFGKIKC